MELSLPRKISGQIKSTPTIGAGLTNTRLGRQHKHFEGIVGLAQGCLHWSGAAMV